MRATEGQILQAAATIAAAIIGSRRDIDNDMSKAVIVGIATDLAHELAEAVSKRMEPESAKDKLGVRDYFKAFPWELHKEGARYTELDKHLRQLHGITSNRRKSDILRASLEVGILRKDEATKRYFYTR